jgi:hypothetical protein
MRWNVQEAQLALHVSEHVVEHGERRSVSCRAW